MPRTSGRSGAVGALSERAGSLPPPVYSYLLAVFDGSSGTVVEQVPAGVQWIARDVSGVVKAALSASLAFAITPDLSSFFDFFSVEQTFGVNQPFHWEGRVVIPPGYSLTAGDAGVIDSVSFTVSGYVLTLP